VIVYWSLGKHASYPTYPSGPAAIIDQIKQPETRVDPLDYALRNAGTLSDPTDLAPWIDHKDKWGPDGVSSVDSELKDPLWSPKPRSIGWIQNRPETIKDQNQIKLIESAIGLKPSGIIDENPLLGQHAESGTN
jgi:hypothetical protein